MTIRPQAGRVGMLSAVSEKAVDPCAAIVAEARAHVAAGRVPDVDALAARIRAVAPGERAEREAIRRLERVVAVHRARALIARDAAREPAASPPPAPVRSLGSALRARPTIVGNLDVRRAPDGEFVLAWDAVPAVTGWEVRLSERPDARSDYRELQALELPATATTVEVPLGERPFRVNVIGRGRDGRPVRRALISALTRDTWGDRWQRRATAS